MGHQLLLTQGRQEEAHRWIDRAYEKLRANGKPLVLTIDETKRTTDQNAKLWPMLSDVARQVLHFGEGMEPEDWKALFMHGLFKDTRVVPGLEGQGFVQLGHNRSSKLTKAQFSDLIELIYAYGAQRNIKWSEKSQAAFAENKKDADQ